MNSTLFVFGNMLGDLAIGVFAFVVWWHEKQDVRLRRVLAIATANNRLTSDEASLAEAYVVIGDQEKLLQVVRGRLDDVYLKKLASLLCAFSALRALTPAVVVCFATGIVIEAIALAV